MTTPAEQTVSPDAARKVAELARLGLSAEQTAAYASDLGRVLGYFRRLSELDLTGVEPLASPLDTAAPLGADVPGPTLPTEALISRAPESMPPYIRVPKVLGETGGA